MPFSGYVCWHPEQVQTVLETEAELMSKAAFRATHQSLELWKKTTFQERQPGEPYTEERFLQEFLDPSQEWVLVPVLGYAGTGKSHLVRWLSTRISSNSKRKVLLLPKTDTNLKDILEKILGLVDDPRLDEFRERLKGATESLTPAQAREALLDLIAQYTGPEYNPDVSGLSREQRYFRNRVPVLLREALIRSALLEEGRFLDRLVTHVLGRSKSVERLDARRDMTVDDLPRSVLNIDQMSAAVRDFYAFLTGQPDQWNGVVAWINRNLDRAIGELIRFRGDDLRQLMRGVREVLAVHQIELVLLIEDFAKLQGIDMQLLDALLERPAQPGRPRMCNLRTAIAMNTGYFLKLPETPGQRFSFHVDLDVPRSPSTRSTADLVPAFAASYLNAVRLRATELDRWHEREPDGSPPPNACAECPYARECHAGFGQADGFGLFPFNRTALMNMLQRVTEAKRREHFTPRFLVKDVLKKVLHDYRDDFLNRTYPSQAQLAAFGQSNLDPAIQETVKRRDRNHAERRLVLLELYSEEISRGEVCDLPVAVHEAFALPPLGVPLAQVPSPDADGGGSTTGTQSVPPFPPVAPETTQPPTAPGPATTPPAGSTPPSPRVPADPVQELYRILTAWANNKQDLPQNVVTELRQLVYEAVDSNLRWDSELLVRDMLIGKVFRATSINFSGQGVAKGIAPVSIELPLPGQERAEVALVLRALKRFQVRRSLQHEDSFQDLQRVGPAVRKWADAIRTQILRPIESSGSGWDLVAVAVEVLTQGSRLANPSLQIPASLAEHINAVLTAPGHTAGRSPEWQEAAEQYSEAFPAVRDLLLSRIACVKGGSDRNLSIIDVSQILSALEDAANRFGFSQRVPAKVPPEYTPVIDIRRKLESRLESVVRCEDEAWRRWEKEVAPEFRPSVSQTVDAVRKFVLFAVDHGKSQQSLREVLQEADSRLNVADLEVLLTMMPNLLVARNPFDRCRTLSLNFPPTLQASREWVRAARSFVTAVAHRTETDSRSFGEGEGNVLETEVEGMQTACTGITEALRSLVGEDRSASPC